LHKDQPDTSLYSFSPQYKKASNKLEQLEWRDTKIAGRAGTRALWWEVEGTGLPQAGEETVLGGPNNHRIVPTKGLVRRDW